RAVLGLGRFPEIQASGHEAATRALETGHDNPVALALGGFGIAYLVGKPEEGVAHIERALVLNPNFLIAWRCGGAAYAMLGEHKKSIEYYERAMQLDPLDYDAVESYQGIALACFFLGRYDDAAVWADRVLRDVPREIRSLM